MNSAKTKATRKSYTLKDKIEIIDLIKSGKSQRDVGNIKGVSRDTVSTVWKNRFKTILKFKSAAVTLKKDRKPKYPQVDKVLYNWLKSQCSLNIPLDSHLLRTKATEFASKLGIEGFKASNGWFERWKSRFDVKIGQISGESISADLNVAADWLRDKWPSIRRDYTDENIFNADETGLFFKKMPEKMFRTTEDAGHGLKKKKDRVTIMLCASMAGEKRKLLLIGKSKRPRCFPKNQNSLPIDYASNKKALMTGILFQSWIRDWNEELRRESRNILLLIDNSSAHIKISNLSNIRIEFFPPNLTTVIQPMNQGIIMNVKTFYRRFMIEKMLSQLDLHNNLLTISLLDAVNLISLAWNSVTSSTIVNCFRQAKLMQEVPEFIEIISDAEFIAENNTLFAQYCDELGIEQSESITMESFISMDMDTETSSPPTEDELLACVFEDEEMSEDDEPEFIEEPLTFDINVHFQVLRNWISANNLPDNLYSHVSALEAAALLQKIKCRVQKKITNMFETVPPC